MTDDPLAELRALRERLRRIEEAAMSSPPPRRSRP